MNKRMEEERVEKRMKRIMKDDEERSTTVAT
jgi:hypothetical protein